MARKQWFMPRYLWLSFLIVGGVLGVGTYYFVDARADRPAFLFGVVERGDVLLQVAATGTLEAVTTVQVGTQVSGTVAELYADFNSEVTKGQLLAKLDPALFEAQVQQAEANVRTAEASLNDSAAAILSARANVQKAKVDVLDKRRKYERNKTLFDESLVSKDDIDTAQAALDAAIASENAADADVGSIEARNKADQARLQQAQAALDTAKLNLDHTVIASPISGTIISRNVDRGQTIAASLASPTLFTIAADLTRMQVNTNIDEADIGRVKTGMEASFTVDAYPGETFQGRITQVRMASATVQNVVTYDAVIDVANPQLKLRPGMTANVKIVIDHASNVLKLPNSALRFKPDLLEADMAAAYQRAGEGEFYQNSWTVSHGTRVPARQGTAPSTGVGPVAVSADRNGSSRWSGANSGNSAGLSQRGRRTSVWILGKDQLFRPVVVRLGLTDGVSTQIVEGSLHDGDKLVIGQEVETKPASAAARLPGFGNMAGPGRR